MKITYEVGDIVTIDDNGDLGDFAAVRVELINRVSATKWKVQSTWDSDIGGGHNDVIDEKHFRLY
jgi:hypothetical protein